MAAITTASQLQSSPKNRIVDHFGSKKTPDIWQGSVVTYLRCGGIFSDDLLLSLMAWATEIGQHLLLLLLLLLSFDQVISGSVTWII